MLLAASGFTLAQAGLIVVIYPVFWGVFQIATGKLSDFTGRKQMLVAGMVVQGLSLILFTLLTEFYQFVIVASLLGIGTAMVYPTFLTAVADLVHPDDRAESIGAFRLWRDSGYAFGAIFAGIVADMIDLSAAISITGIIAVGSAIYIALRMNALNKPVSKRFLSS
ncbi:MAG: MFS transporter [Balneolaceae bacterium]|nr:MAG: MFS transporter [Balneolaceae bacterium]